MRTVYEICEHALEHDEDNLEEICDHIPEEYSLEIACQLVDMYLPGGTSHDRHIEAIRGVSPYEVNRVHVSSVEDEPGHLCVCLLYSLLYGEASLGDVALCVHFELDVPYMDLHQFLMDCAEVLEI